MVDQVGLLPQLFPSNVRNLRKQVIISVTYEKSIKANSINVVYDYRTLTFTILYLYIY